MSELEEIKELARDAVSALRYIEQTYGRLHGVGWNRVFESAKDILSPPNSITIKQTKNDNGQGS